MLSQIYKLLSSNDRTLSIPIDKWTIDTIYLSDHNWLNICNNKFLMTCNSKSQLIQYKVLHRTHITTHKFYHMGFSQSNTCLHCSTSIDNYFHAFCLCPRIQNIWSEILGRLSRMCSITICPIIALLCDLSTLHMPSHHRPFILILLTIAKKTILLNWKDRTKVS